MADVLEIYPDREPVERDFTEEELAQREIDAAAYEAKVAEETAKAEAKTAALAKLGLTEEELVALFG